MVYIVCRFLSFGKETCKGSDLRSWGFHVNSELEFHFTSLDGFCKMDSSSVLPAVQVNRHLLKDLIARNLWNEEMRVKLIAHNGSVQYLDLPQELPEIIKEGLVLLSLSSRWSIFMKRKQLVKV